MTDFIYPKECLLTDNIENEAWQQLMESLNAREITVEKNEILHHEGDAIDTIGIVLVGKLILFREAKNGRRFVLETLAAGQTFGISATFTGKRVLPASVRATENAQILLLEANKIMSENTKACRAYTSFLQNLLKLISQRELRSQQEIHILSQRTIREKLLLFLNMEAAQHGTHDFRIAFDRQELADYLCVDRCALSNEISKMRNEKIIESAKSHFKLIGNP